MNLPQPGVMTQRKHLPSVTEIIGACHLGVELPISDQRLAFVLQRGTALHSAIELDLADDLDESSVHQDIAVRLEAFRKFAASVKLVPIATEIELDHPAWRYTGHPDLVGLVNGRRTLLDWKAGHFPHAARIQIAAYGELWSVNRPDDPIEQYLVVHLKADGSFSVHGVDPRPAWPVFQACVVVWYARRERERA